MMNAKRNAKQPKLLYTCEPGSLETEGLLDDPQHEHADLAVVLELAGVLAHRALGDVLDEQTGDTVGGVRDLHRAVGLDLSSDCTHDLLVGTERRIGLSSDVVDHRADSVADVHHD